MAGEASLNSLFCGNPQGQKWKLTYSVFFFRFLKAHPRKPWTLFYLDTPQLNIRWLQNIKRIALMRHEGWNVRMELSSEMIKNSKLLFYSSWNTFYFVYVFFRKLESRSWLYFPSKLKNLMSLSFKEEESSEPVPGLWHWQACESWDTCGITGEQHLAHSRCWFMWVGCQTSYGDPCASNFCPNL